MELMFTPRDDPRSAPAADGLFYEEVSVDLPFVKQFDPSEQTDRRHAKYAEAAAACGALRTKPHVCTLLRVDVRAGSRPRMRPMVLNGSATLATLRRKSNG